MISKETGEGWHFDSLSDAEKACERAWAELESLKAAHREANERAAVAESLRRDAEAERDAHSHAAHDIQVRLEAATHEADVRLELGDKSTADCVRRIRMERDALKARVKNLSAYVRHTADCDLVFPARTSGSTAPPRCTCGLDEALAAVPKEESNEETQKGH